MVLKQFFYNLIDFIYPHLCQHCYSPLSYDDVLYCQDCWNALEIIQPPFCPYCGAPEEDDHCTPDEFIFSQTRSMAEFNQDILKKAIHLLKYKQHRSVGRYLGTMLGDVLVETDGFEDIDYIIPVPLHSTRFRERGYNQSDIIAKGIADVINSIVLGNELQRNRNTVSQTTLTVDERKKNVKGAFIIQRPQKIENKKILLVDDVFTTGSTLNSCAEAIALANPKDILAATIARA